MNDKSKTAANEDSDNGDIPKEVSSIERANKAAERLEAANKENERLLAREEELRADAKLDGKSDAGVVEKKEETDTEYAQRMGFIDEDGN